MTYKSITTVLKKIASSRDHPLCSQFLKDNPSLAVPFHLSSYNKVPLNKSDALYIKSLHKHIDMHPDFATVLIMSVVLSHLATPSEASPSIEIVNQNTQKSRCLCKQ